MRLLFEHGAFTAEDTAATARAPMWLMLALPAHVPLKAPSPALFAREDTIVPLTAILKGVALAIAAAFLSPWSGADGIAAAIALGAGSMAFSLIRRGAKTFGSSIDTEAAAAAAHRARGARDGRAVWLATRSLPALTAGAHGLVQAVLLLAVIAAGIAIYGLFLRLFGVTGWREAVNAVSKAALAGLR